MPRTREVDPRRVALGLLARREHSAGELRQKLNRRGFSRGQTEPAIARLADEGWLSEQRFAEAYARSRFERGYGPNRIRLEMAARGVAAAVTEEVLAGYGGSWEGRLEDLHRRRFGGAAPAARAARGHQYRFLRQRGFTGEQIAGLFRRLDAAGGR